MTDEPGGVPVSSKLLDVSARGRGVIPPLVTYNTTESRPVEDVHSSALSSVEAFRTNRSSDSVDRKTDRDDLSKRCGSRMTRGLQPSAAILAPGTCLSGGSLVLLPEMSCQ